MADISMENNFNKEEKKAVSRKNGPLFLVVSAVIVSIVLLILAVLSLFKTSIFYYLAEKRCYSGEYVSALNMLDECNNDRGNLLTKYCSLRNEIVHDYPAMLSNFNEEKLDEWVGAIESIYSDREKFSILNTEEMLSLYNDLEEIRQNHNELTELYPDVYELMDVFTVINSITSADDSGKNQTFTPAEIREKLREWKEIETRLNSFSAKFEGSDSVYLLNYLVAESNCEFGDIEEVLTMVKDAGYGDNQQVRLQSTGVKTFKQIKNTSGDSVSVSEKEKYIEYMFNGINNALIKTLNEYYG